MRTTDFVARLGGDEFTVLIPECPLDRGRTALERVCEATPGGQTSSAGVVCWDGAETPDAVFARADAALYQAKEAGRGQAVAA